jgi:hypothetical protein
MKRTYLIILPILVIGNLFAQEQDDIAQHKLLQKIVIDIGATPLSKSFGDNPHMTSYNFSLGYQINKRLDLRLNLDILNIFSEEINEWNRTLNIYERLLGPSIGIGFIAFNGKDDTFLKNKSLGFVGKFGVGIEPQSRMQESLFFDISTRAYLGKIPFIAIGINRQITDVFKGSDFTSLYLAFGINF